VSDQLEPNVIDGFASVLAVRRAKRRQDAQKTARSPAGATPPPHQAPPKLGEAVEAQKGIIGRFARTIIPVRYEIACYECEYSFHISGQIRETRCPKCRAILKGGDHVIDKECFQPIRTTGNVELRQGSVLRGVDVTAKDIILAGSAEHGSLHSCGRLELWPGARFDSTRLKVKDLVVRHGARFILPQAIRCRNVEVEGELNAIIFAEGLVTLRTGGLLAGEIDCARLVVEEGGGLEAHVCVGARSSAPSANVLVGIGRNHHLETPGRN
jgi:cytoskeletal protein CcmA (bactofilin family)